MKDLNLNEIATVVPILIGVLQLFKMMGLESKWTPLVALFFGIILGYTIVGTSNIQILILTSLAIATSAMGTYSALKSTKENVENKFKKSE